MPTIQEIRSRFPALGRDTVYLDNAGGSQLPDLVIDAVREFLTTSFVSTGAAYPASVRSTETIRRAHEVVKYYLNAAGPDGGRVGQGIGEVILGSSSTALCYTLASAFADAKAAGTLGSRNEIIIGTFGHEANVGPWMKLANRGFIVKEWPVEIDADGTPRPLLSTLKKLLSSSTLLVAFPQVSNILGEIYDPKEITRICHEAGAQALVDGVAYAPHHAPDVAAFGCDWYVYSTYKVFGPHMAALFGRREVLEKLTGPNHYFIPRTNMPAKWEVGGCSSEGCSMINALWPYVCFMADTPQATTLPLDSSIFKRAFGTMAKLEDTLMRRIVSFLSSHSSVEIIGPIAVDERRVCIASFTSKTRPSSEIAKAMNAQGFGIRSGSFYSPRLCEQLKIDPVEGVVRISLAHYNSIEEVDATLAALEKLI